MSPDEIDTGRGVGDFAELDFDVLNRPEGRGVFGVPRGRRRETDQSFASEGHEVRLDSAAGSARLGPPRREPAEDRDATDGEAAASPPRSGSGGKLEWNFGNHVSGSLPLRRDRGWG